MKYGSYSTRPGTAGGWVGNNSSYLGIQDAYTVLSFGDAYVKFPTKKEIHTI